MRTMSDINGKWRSGDAVIVFGDDTLILGQRRFAWEEGGDCLYILPAEAQIVVPYRCERDTLRLDVDGVVSVWSRVHDI